MPIYQKRPIVTRRFQFVLSSFLQKDGLPFAEVLPEDQIEEAFAEEEAAFAEDEDSIYTPPITIWAFLSQVLHKEEQRSCIAAVSRVIVLLVALGLEPCSKASGAYCKARSKLSEKVIHRLVTDLADGCEDELPEKWLWHKRHVKSADGSTVSMPDTEENQAAYPQQAGQQEGLGFPIARMMVLFSLATGMVTDMAMSRYAGKETGEAALMRELLDRLEPNDILLSDRILCSYFMIALILSGKRDFVVRLHQTRKVDFERAKRLGKGDHLVTWKRPKKPQWMDQETYEQTPETLTVRLLEVQVNEPGFRTESLHVVSTLTDATQYPKDDIAQLYRKRWLAELDLRALKVSLGMDVLRCKTPEMVRKEIWICLLAYNLIRKAMLQAAKKAKVAPRELSFTTAMQTIASSFLPLLLVDASTAASLIDVQLSSITKVVVGNRPDRFEPRAVKRRPKPIRLLNMTREEARESLRRGVDPYAKQK